MINNRSSNAVAFPVGQSVPASFVSVIDDVRLHYRPRGTCHPAGLSFLGVMSD